MKIKKNFSFEKLMKSKALVEWLNLYGNAINKNIQDGLKNATDIYGRRFESGGEFTHGSIQDGHAHKRPLVRSGRMSQTRKLPAKGKKLSFVIKGGVNKSKARWNLEVNGKKSSGTRGKGGVNYGALHNTGYKTGKKSLIPGKTVPRREWFGIAPTFLVGGAEWKRFRGLMHFTLQKYLRSSK